jgi:DNA-binding IclR family transcriptional regulator
MSGHTPTKQQLAILEALAKAKDGFAAYDISRLTGLWSGTLYPQLQFLEDVEAITSEWLPGPFPRRRIYKLASTAPANRDEPTQDTTGIVHESPSHVEGK